VKWFVAAGWVAPLCAQAACVALPAPQIDLTANGYYTDARHSEVSADLQRRNREATMPGRRFLGEVSKAADRFHANPDADALAAQCALAGLAQWARAGALLGRMQGPSQGQQAEYERKWLLSGVALAYLKLKPAADETQRATIEPWLAQMADAMWRFWEDAEGRPTDHRRNNHYTWAGLALAATAFATHDEARWQLAQRVFVESLANVQDDGRLPLEMTRGALALHYHAFTAGPLVVMAELSQARGKDWPADAQQAAALQRLVDVVLQGLAEPSGFAADQQQLPTPATLAWLALWQKYDRRPERITTWLNKLPAVPTLGGDLELMARRGW
jgi:poly(beta-D-mannuronate) lyase